MSYGGDVNRGPFLNVINWIFNSVALTAVVLRLVSRRLLEKKPWSTGDGLVVFAMTVNLVRAIYVSAIISMGFGQHLIPLVEADPVKATALLRLLVILQAIGLWTFTLPKLPVVALLTRLFGFNKPAVRYVLLGSVSIQLIMVMIMTITTFVQCEPIAAQWDLSVEGTCWARYINVDIGYSVGAYSAFLDAAYATFAILQVSKLQMEQSRKILIASSLSLGYVAAITTCYKQSLIDEISSTQDFTWATVPLEVWNSVEGCALLIAASLPLTKPLMLTVGQGLLQLTSSIFSTQRGSSGGKHSTGSSGIGIGSSGKGGGARLRAAHAAGAYKLSSKDNILLHEGPARSASVGGKDAAAADFASTPPPQDGIRVEREYTVREQGRDFV